MALSILDGTQTATTLSTILSSGQHITAHTVVSLGTQAITDILNATSAGLTNTQLRASAVTVGGTVTVGNSVTISSLPAISGTVTVGQIQGYQHGTAGTFGPYSADVVLVGEDIEASKAAGLVVIQAARLGGLLGGRTSQGDTPICVYGDNGSAVTISGTVTVGNTVTIAGTVTANPTGTQTIAGTVTIGNTVTASISGTVPVSISSVTVGNSVTIGSLPAISGTVTANLSISATAITSGSFASLTSATLVPGNTARKMATVYNLGAGQLFVQAGGTTATTLGGGFMVALSSGDYFECGFTTTTLSAIFATAGTASWMSH